MSRKDSIIIYVGIISINNVMLLFDTKIDYYWVFCKKILHNNNNIAQLTKATTQPIKSTLDNMATPHWGLFYSLHLMIPPHFEPKTIVH